MNNMVTGIKSKQQIHTLRSFKVAFKIRIICDNNDRLNMTVKDYNTLRRKAEKIGYGRELANFIQDYMSNQMPEKMSVLVDTISS